MSRFDLTTKIGLVLEKKVKNDLKLEETKDFGFAS